MKITILGSGTFMPDLKRKEAGYLLEIGKEKIIFDFGRGNIDRLLELKVNLISLNKIFLSHMHADHCSELISFLFFIRYYPDKKKLKEKYTIYGPRGIKKNLHMIFDGYGVNKKKLLKRIKIKELSDKKEINFGALKVKAFEVIHSRSRKCLSYRVISKKKILCYSGDSADCVGLRKACKNADLAIVEATLPRSYGVEKHLDGKELGKLAKEEKIKKLIVTHVADFYLPQVKKEVKENYKGKIIIAKDLMEIKIK